MVFSSYSNAYAIYKGAKKLGIKVFTVDRYATFPIPSGSRLRKAEYLFFTEEASLRLALTGELEGDYWPSQFPANLLDDKWAFVHWLNGTEGLPVGLPQWPLGEYRHVSYPCLLKAKHSWVDAIKMPRGWICRSKEELDERLAELELTAYNPDHFFMQKWAGDLRCKVISVCGYFDSLDHMRNLVSVVERIASHRQGLSCSSAIQTIDDQWGLIAKTGLILDAINFRGPYEMEYVVVGEEAFVLELNPRFWMQHALFLRFGNGLVKRYLGLDNEDDYEISEIKNAAWVDGVHLISSMLRLRLDFLLLVLNQLFKKPQRVVIWPSMPVAVLVIWRVAWRRLLSRVLGCRFVASI